VYLEKSIARERERQPGVQAIEDLCRRLNQRIKAWAYHVSPEFLEMRGTATHTSSQPMCVSSASACPAIRNACRAGMEKASSMMQVLARPFSRAEICGMVPYFGNTVASGSIEFRVVEVPSISAVLAMRFSGCTLRQVGPYRRRSAR